MPILGQPFDPMQLQMMTQAQQDPYVAELLKRLMAGPPQRPPEESQGAKGRHVIGDVLAGLGDAMAARASVLGRTGLDTSALERLRARRLLQRREEEAGYQRQVEQQETGKREAAKELYGIRTAKKPQDQTSAYDEREENLRKLKALGFQPTPQQEFSYLATGKGLFGDDEDPLVTAKRIADLGALGVIPPGLTPEQQAMGKSAMEYETKQRQARTASTAEGKVGGMTEAQIMSRLNSNYSRILNEMGVPLRRTTVTTFNEDGDPVKTDMMVPVPTPDQRVKAKKATLNTFSKVIRDHILRDMPYWAEQLDAETPPPTTGTALEDARSILNKAP